MHVVTVHSALPCVLLACLPSCVPCSACKVDPGISWPQVFCTHNNCSLSFEQLHAQVSLSSVQKAWTQSGIVPWRLHVWYFCVYIRLVSACLASSMVETVVCALMWEPGSAALSVALCICVGASVASDILHCQYVVYLPRLLSWCCFMVYTFLRLSVSGGQTFGRSVADICGIARGNEASQRTSAPARLLVISAICGLSWQKAFQSLG